MLRLEPSPEKSASPVVKGGVRGDLTDEEVADLLRRGSRAAATAVYDRFSALVNRWVWRLLGADAEHDDIVQQVFVRILRAGPNLRDSDKLAGWVHAITVNTVHGAEGSIAAVVDRFKPQVESMEGAAFMYACLVHDVRFAQVRAVSNVVERRDRARWKVSEAIHALGASVFEILDAS